MKDAHDRRSLDWIHFEIRKSVIHDGLQREFVEIFDTIEPSDYHKEIEKLKSVNPNELKVITITNIGRPCDERH